MTLRHIISPEERRAKLKNLLNLRGFIRGMEVHNALSGLIINDLKVPTNYGEKEFDFFWESSLTDSASKGHPDIEIISFDSRLKTITEILEVTDKPMIVDGDTGGDIHHFEYLIPKLERAGVSAVIIEDKIFPKRNSLEEGTNQDQEEPEIFCQKIATGKRIQKSNNFMIIARIESLIAGKSVEEALFRARKYLLAGADGIMIHSKSSNPQEIFDFAEGYGILEEELGIRRPLVCVPTTYNSVYERELKEKGFNMVIYGNHMLRASFKSMEKVAKLILENERGLEAEPWIASTKEIFEKVGFLDVKEKDKLLSNKPTVIIPAAGEESEEFRLSFGELPRALIPINEKTLLEHQIESFKNFGLSDITVITGWKKERFSIPGVNYVNNENYASTGQFHSLMCAKHKMKNGFIYVNGDVLVDERLIKELASRKEDIIIVIDNSYLYHKHEIDKKLDAVITKCGRQDAYQRLRDLNDEVIKIGRNISREIMTHEFIGLAKFSKEGAEKLIQFYEEWRQFHQGKFNEAENFYLASDTDMFQELVNRGIKVAVHETNGGWLEIHKPKDLSYVQEILNLSNSP